MNKAVYKEIHVAKNNVRMFYNTLENKTIIGDQVNKPCTLVVYKQVQ